ncbi:MAG: DMT family transporter [Coriobacteriales bacterium]|jgi:drug/metabolite transporter (DMT)-like permease|nr:DMT family transporter [Coriobacteriales bacterium]
MPIEKSRHPVRSSLVLLLTAFIWGIAFVAQRVGMDYIGPFLFAGMRFWLGALTLLALLLISRLIRRNNTDKSTAWPVMPRRQLVKAGVICGLFLFIGGALQQVGLVFTSASKAGFLTALYIVLVPVLGIIVRNKTHWNTWIGVVMAFAGIYFLSITKSLTIEPGDLIIIIGAFFWAGHILAVDRFVGAISQREVLKFCVVQFIFAGSLALLATPWLDAFFVDRVFDLPTIYQAAVPILYAGILSTGVAFTFQAIGQQGLPPAAAAIIMSLEAVFSVLGGMVLLHEVLSGRELFGCLLMFAAVIVAQLPQKHRQGNT